MARLDSGDVKLQVEQLSLSDLVFYTVQDLESEAAGKGVILTVCNTSNSANVPVIADMGMIQRVLENLVFNAIRHTPQGATGASPGKEREYGSRCLHRTDCGIIVNSWMDY